MLELVPYVCSNIVPFVCIYTRKRGEGEKRPEEDEDEGQDEGGGRRVARSKQRVLKLRSVGRGRWRIRIVQRGNVDYG